VLKLNDKVVCDSKAKYGQDSRNSKGGMGGHSHGRRAADGPQAAADDPSENWEVITEMTQCTRPVAVKKGDKIQMESFYDGEKHPPRPTKNSEGHMMEADEMGVFFINFAASNKTAEQLTIRANERDGTFLTDAWS